MRAIEDGGPASPSWFIVGEQRIPHPGMSLRDYFAAHAIDAAYRQCEKAGGTSGWECLAQIAYIVADHMIAERARSTSSAASDEGAG